MISFLSVSVVLVTYCWAGTIPQQNAVPVPLQGDIYKSYIVSVESKPKYDHLCSAVLLSPTYVITSAYCVYGLTPAETYVRATSTPSIGGYGSDAKQFIFHPKFGEKAYEYAVAIIEVGLNHILSLSPISLVKSSPKSGSDAVSYGFANVKGVYSMIETVLPVVDKKNCVNTYNGIAKVASSVICAGIAPNVSEICLQDVGGALVVKDELAGIYLTSYDCNNPELPSWFADVTTAKDFVYSIIGKPEGEDDENEDDNKSDDDEESNHNDGNVYESQDAVDDDDEDDGGESNECNHKHQHYTEHHHGSNIFIEINA